MFARTVLKISALLLLVALAATARAEEKLELFPKNTWELAYQLEHIDYEESGLMQETGWMHGLAGSYETRLGDTSALLWLEAEALAGGLDYDGHYSDGTPTTTDTDDFLFEARAMAGWEFKVDQQVGLAPYLGLGWRYWNDMIRGTGGYEREIAYWYLPIGLETVAVSGDRLWRVGGRAEYDLFLHGTATSHLGDAVAGWDTVENDQNSGWGMRASIFAERAVGKDWSFVMEPFFRYWDIAKSEDANLTSDGRIIGKAWEPANTTTTWGLRLGARY